MARTTEHNRFFMARIGEKRPARLQSFAGSARRLLGLRFKSPQSCFIHVGKCGGSAVKQLLEESGSHFIEYHTRPANFHRKVLYIACIRSPISRFVSSFNYRYDQVVIQGKPKNEEEAAGLAYFQTPDKLAAALSDPALAHRAKSFIQLQQKHKHHPEHIEMGLSWYLNDLLTKHDVWN